MKSNQMTTLLIIGLFGASVLDLALCETSKEFSNTWVVEVKEDLSPAEVEKLAADLGFISKGKIFADSKLYEFHHPRVSKRSFDMAHEHHSSLHNHVQIRSAEQQVILKRVKRAHVPEPAVTFTDPKWPSTWYLNRGINSGQFDMNVIPAWNMGYTGSQSVVTILDDGIERTHPDLAANYDAKASYDINGNDDDPMPRYDFTNENRHGTRCAGEVAAVADNGVCSVGVAYNASIGGIRMLDGDVTDSVEAKSLGYNQDYIDIYSASWGPDDNGRTVDGPGRLAKEAFERGVNTGRGGKGNIFVWASGNGGNHHDSCACDGYTNSIYTLSVSSVQQNNNKPWYLEECASTMASTYSSGQNFGMKKVSSAEHNNRSPWYLEECASTLATTYSSGYEYESGSKVITTDLHHMCTESHTGTSASAPLAAGLVAQMLSANHKLQWRDVQYIVMLTSNPEPLKAYGDFHLNGNGKFYSHSFGYGLMDAAAMCKMAANWRNVPEPALITASPAHTDVRTIHGDTDYEEKIRIQACVGQPSATCTSIKYLEHVQLELTVGANHRGSLQVELTSPSGTKSTVLPWRSADYNSAQFPAWPFLSVHFWGENPAGEWTFRIKLAANSDTGGIYILKMGANDAIQWGTCVENRSSLASKLRFRVTQSDYDLLYVDCSGHITHSRLILHGLSTDPITEAKSVKCHQYCDVRSGCSAPGPDHCIKCVATMNDTVNGTVQTVYRVSDIHSCVLTCPEEGYYTSEETSTCKNCHPSCLTCEDGESCTTCRKDLLLDTSNYCVDECPIGEFMNINADGKRCDNCPKTCQSCDSKTQCTACRPGFELVSDGKEKKCQRPCGEKQYRDWQLACTDCNIPNCAACVLDSETHSPQCVTCSSEYLLYVGSRSPGTEQCVEACPYHTFISMRNDQPECIDCFTDCNSCYDNQDNNCENCIDSYILTSLNMCFDPSDCPTKDGKFIEANGTCGACHDTCKTCTGADVYDCITCPRDRSMKDGMCVSECGGEYFQSTSTDNNSICERCHPSCLTCLGSSDADCKTCLVDLGRINTLESNAERDAVDGSCINQSCEPGKFKLTVESADCTNCSSSCHTCIGSSETDCTGCTEGFLTESGRCESNCPSGYYPEVLARGSEHTARCLRCHLECGSCTGPLETQCVSCPFGKVKTIRGMCLDPVSIDCNDNQFLNETSLRCHSCASTCKACFGPNENDCTMCPDSENQALIRGNCLDCCTEEVLASGDKTICIDCFAYKAKKDNTDHQNTIKTSLIAISAVGILSCVTLFFVIFGVLQYFSGQCASSVTELRLTDPKSEIRYNTLPTEHEDVLYSADDGLTGNGYAANSRQHATLDSD